MFIGEVLTELFDIGDSEINKALELQKEVGGYVGQILISMGAVNEIQLMAALSKQMDIPLFDRESMPEIDADFYAKITGLIDTEYLLRQRYLPISAEFEGGVDDSPVKCRSIVFITNDPLKSSALDYASKVLGCRVNLMLAAEQVINELSRPLLTFDKDLVSLTVDDNPELLREMASEAPVIKFLNNILSNAVELRASDIHMEPSESASRIKLRIDGVLHESETVNEKLFLALVSRVKLLARLDIAEKRLPQDGKFSTKISATLIDVRVSSIPFAIGEGVVMRLLYRERLTFDITKLGIEKDVEPTIMELINMPYGILLVTGPTGSGKTTSLYSMLSSLDKKEKKIITVEDPVEYKIDGINQIQVKDEIGLSFAACLRSILRHDPDVIMVGEIRDPETAAVAVQSALTGHLVLSTLHTNDAPSSLFRLIEMGLEGYLLNASILGIIAQRIIRRNCPFCSKPFEPSKALLDKYPIMQLYERYKDVLGLKLDMKRGTGCRKCAGTGYRGMIAVYEVFKYAEDLKEQFLKEQSIIAMRKSLIEHHGFRTLREDGLLKVIAGTTTVEEVLRVS
ncbi:MAG: type II/IV secretion system protein [Nitrospirae bacterium]|nr:type II/IV secretion system protein [Nitrospirota bacterium]